MDFREMVLVFCAFCVFGGIFANAGMIVVLLITSRRKRRGQPTAVLPVHTATAENAVQYAPGQKDMG